MVVWFVDLFSETDYTVSDIDQYIGLFLLYTKRGQYTSIGLILIIYL